jgi:predicted MFS family arabinose efflux permease
VLLIGAAMAALVLPLTVGREERWPVWAWTSLAVAVPLLVLFARYQAALGRREGGSPLIDVAMLRNRTFAAGVAITAVQFLTMGAFWLLQAIYLQQGRGFSPIGAGIEALVVGLGFFLSAGAAPKLAEQLGGRVLAIGGVTLAVGYGLIALATAHVGVGGTVAWLYPGMLLAGFGMGLVVAPLSSMTLATVGPRNAAAAAGVLSTSQEVGVAFGVTFVGLVFFRLVGPAESLGSFPAAIEWSLALLAVFALGVAALSRLMPQGPAPAPAEAASNALA